MFFRNKKKIQLYNIYSLGGPCSTRQSRWGSPTSWYSRYFATTVGVSSSEVPNSGQFRDNSLYTTYLGVSIFLHNLFNKKGQGFIFCWIPIPWQDIVPFPCWVIFFLTVEVYCLLFIISILIFCDIRLVLCLFEQ